MTYKVTASPLKGHHIIKEVNGVHELHNYLSECRELDYTIKHVRRVKQPMLRLTKILQAA